MTAPDQNLAALLAPQTLYGGAYKSKGLKHCTDWKKMECKRCVKYESGPKDGPKVFPKGKKDLSPEDENERRAILVADLGRDADHDINQALVDEGYVDTWEYASATGFDKAYRHLTGVTTTAVLNKLLKGPSKPKSKSKSKSPRKSENIEKDHKRRSMKVAKLGEAGEELLNLKILQSGRRDNDWEDISTQDFDYFYKKTKEELKASKPKKVSFKKKPSVREIPARKPKKRAYSPPQGPVIRKASSPEASEEEKEEKEEKGEPPELGVRRALIDVLGPGGYGVVTSFLPRGVTWDRATTEDFQAAYKEVMERRKRGTLSKSRAQSSSEIEGEGLIGGQSLIGGCGCCGSALVGGGPYGTASNKRYPITSRACSNYTVHSRSRAQQTATGAISGLMKEYKGARRDNPKLTRAQFFREQVGVPQRPYVPKAVRNARQYEGYKALIALHGKKKGAALIGGGEYATCEGSRSVISSHPVSYEYKQRTEAQQAASDLLAARNARFKIAKQENPNLTRAEFFQEIAPHTENRYVTKADRAERTLRRLRAITDRGFSMPQAA